MGKYYYDSIQDVRAFDEQIWETVQEYLDEKDCYSSDVVLAINGDTHEIMVESPSKLTDNYDQYNLSSLIRPDEEGNPEPDGDATEEIANLYFCIR